MQMLMLSPDGVVLHALAGFWHPEDLDRELKFAMELWDVWKDKSLTREAKDKLFSSKQIEAWKNHPRETTLRSRWQGFDAKNEAKRIAAGIKRDTVVGSAIQRKLNKKETVAVSAIMEKLRKTKSTEKPARLKMKPINQLVHERMSVRPFLKLQDFDIPEFADYGRTYYDNNKKVDGSGSTLMTPKRVAKADARKRKQEMKEKARARKLARKEQRRRNQRERQANQE